MLLRALIGRCLTFFALPVRFGQEGLFLDGWFNQVNVGLGWPVVKIAVMDELVCFFNECVVQSALVVKSFT